MIIYTLEPLNLIISLISISGLALILPSNLIVFQLPLRSKLIKAIYKSVIINTVASWSHDVTSSLIILVLMSSNASSKVSANRLSSWAGRIGSLVELRKLAIMPLTSAMCPSILLLELEPFAVSDRNLGAIKNLCFGNDSRWCFETMEKISNSIIEHLGEQSPSLILINIIRSTHGLDFWNRLVLSNSLAFQILAFDKYDKLLMELFAI